MPLTRKDKRRLVQLSLKTNPCIACERQSAQSDGVDPDKHCSCGTSLRERWRTMAAQEGVEA